MLTHLFVFAGSATALILIVLALILVFEVWMFVDVLKNTALTNETRLLWAFGMLLIHPFVAIAYYFTDHKIA